MNKLKDLRNEKNILQKDISKYLKIKQNTYSQYENCIRDIPTKILKRISTFYKVNIDYILGLTDIKKLYPKSKINNVNFNRLKEVREDRDLYQKDIAKILNINQKSYSTYETGLCDISTDNIKKLALYYNLSIDYLLYITDDREPHKRK